MARRIYFNWKLAIVLLIGFVVLGTTAIGLRRWQRSRRAADGLKLGLKAYRESKWEEAAKNLGRHIAVRRDDVSALMKYADAQLKIRPSRASNIRQATETYRTVLRIDKDNSEAARRLIEIYLETGSVGEAELITRRQLEIEDDPDLRRMLATALAGQRKFDEAAEQLQSLIQEYPDQIPAYEVLSRLNEQWPQEFSQTPVYWLNEAVDNNPTSAMAYIARAAFHRRNEDTASALDDLRRAEKCDLSDLDVRLSLAEEFVNANALDEAEQHLSQVQEASPSDQTLWQVWAQLALQSQSEETMVEVAEAALAELAPQLWDFLPTATELFIKGGELDRAADCISDMREKGLQPGTVAFLQGLLAEQRGDFYQAVKSWRRALDSGNKAARVRLALASALSRLGDRQSALSQLRTLVSEYPDFAGGHLALIRLLARNGNWNEVAERTREAVQVAPENAEARIYDLKARINLLAARQTAPNSAVWQSIENELSELERATSGSRQVKLARFRLAMLRNDLSAAEQILAQLRQEYPLQTEVALAEAELLTARNKTDEAIQVLQDVTKDSPEAIGAIGALALLLHQQDKRQRCEKTLRSALERAELPATRRELALLLAQLYTRWQEPEKAYELLASLARAHLDDIPIMRRLLACPQVINDVEEAQELVDKIKSLEGEDGWQWRYEQARLWFLGEDFEEHYPRIVTALQTNLLANPDDQASRVLLAAAYERAGELQLAIASYREALKRSPDDLRIIIPTIAALDKAGEQEKVREILRRTQEQDLVHPQLTKLQLESYLRQGQWDLASGILEDYLQKDPNNREVCLSLAQLKIQQQQFEEAEQLLNKVRAQSPDSLLVIQTQVELKIRQNKPQEALQFCNEVINDLKSGPAYILRAQTYARLRQNDKATEDFQRAVAIEPRNAKIWVDKSNFHRMLGQPNEARTAIQRALSLDPNNLDVQKRAIPLLLASAEPNEVHRAKNILERALQSDPNDIDLRLLKARSLLVDGTDTGTEQATQILQGITEEQPENSEAWKLLGQVYLRRNQPLRATDVALRGLVYQPNDKGLLLVKARAEELRSPAVAIPTLHVLRSLDPNDTYIATLLANAYIDTGRPDKAIALMSEQKQLCKPAEQHRCEIVLAVALQEEGRKEEAQQALDAVIAATGMQPVINLATELTASKNASAKERGEDILRMILERDSDCTKAALALAVYLQTTGRSAEAAELYNHILEVDPDNVIVMNNLAWILCKDQGRYRQALALAQKGLEIAPEYVDLIDTRGVTYYHLGEWDKAVDDFTTCIKLSPEAAASGAASRFHLAKALNRLGEKSKAMEHLNRALALHSQTGGLSETEVDDAKRMLEQLRKGS
jgi:tetratricopeptide (TPR) repeat protein